jgi:signal transduction histidine kinase
MSLSSPAHPAEASAMPLPPDVVVHASWFGRARQFPIFGGAWFRYRSIAFLSGLLVTALLIAAMAAIPLQPKDVDWIDVLRIGAVFVTPCVVLVLVGPALAVWVRARGWPVRREFAGILCALLLGMVASVAAGFQLKDWYESARVDSSGTRVIRLLPRVQFSVNWQAGPKVDVDPGMPWRRLSPEEQRTVDALTHAQQELARLAPPGGSSTPAPPLTPQESAAMEAYLKLKSENRPFTPAEERATRPGLAAFEKLLRYQAELAMRPPPQPVRTTSPSPAYVAAQKKYDEAAAAYLRFQASWAPAPAAPLPAAGGPSTAGVTSAVFLACATLLLVCWLGGLTDLVAFVRQRGKLDDVLRDQALRRADAARAEAELRLSVLAAQVEPHFLFNTLASVRSAIVSDQARAAAIVDHLADYLRATIPQMRDEAARGSVPLGHQLDAARAYLALMHERMPRLAFAMEAEPGLETAQVPPLMLISLVENALKHGVEPKAGPARITVAARRAVEAGEALLELEVRDDGVGFGSATSGAGVGLANIQERLAGLYGRKAGLTLKALPEGGVAAILRLPLTFPATA